MMAPTRVVLAGCFGLALAACAVDPTPESPGLFSAYDPTVQCPVDQLGWDLSTGGGLEPLQRNSVGDAIKLINANLTSCGLTGMELRSSCDGEAECVKPVTCDDAAVDVTFVCACPNDAPVRREGEPIDGVSVAPQDSNELTRG